MKPLEYRYAAKVVRVVDADTLDVEIDLGFGVWTAQRLRLVGPGGIYADAWETRGAERERGLAASAYVEHAIFKLQSDVHVVTYMETGKFGRYLAAVQVAPRGMDGWDLAEALWKHGHAKRLGDMRRTLDDQEKR